MSDIDGFAELPFEVDNGEEMHFSSIAHCLEYAYCCAEAAGALGDSFYWIDKGIKQFGDHPDLLSFITIYNIKNYNAYKDEYDLRDCYRDKYAEQLIKMPHDIFSIRSYVACITYLLHCNAQGNMCEVEELARELASKYPHDIVNEYVSWLIEYKKDADDISQWKIDEAKAIYSSLYPIQVTTDNYSDYITSILPIIELIADEFQWPSKEYMKRYGVTSEKVCFGLEDYQSYVKYTPYCSNSDNILIYIHGGSFQEGSNEDDSEFLSKLAERTSTRVISVGYRNIDSARSLGKMISDIVASVNAIVANEKISNIHLVGSSSGAYLTWVVAIMYCNKEKYSISSNITIRSVLLISGYLVFGSNDGITRMLSLFPAFQHVPTDLKNADMDYSGYNTPNLFLVTGEKDSCKMDSVMLYERVKQSGCSNQTKLFVAESDKDNTDHCFITNTPNTTVSREVFNKISQFYHQVMAQETDGFEF